MRFLRRLLTFNITLILAVAFSFSPAYAFRCESLFLSDSPSKISEILTDDFVRNSYEKIRKSQGWIGGRTLSLHHLKVFKESLEELNRLDTNLNPELNNPRFNQILKRTVLHPENELTAEEIQFLAGHPTYAKTFQNTLRVMLTGESLVRFFLRIEQYIEGRASSVQILQEKSWAARVRSLMRGLYNGPLRFLVPVVYLPRLNSQVDLIFAKQYKNPDYTPTAEEQIVLDRYKADRVFADKKDFMRTHSSWTAFRRWLGRSTIALVMAVNLAFVGNWAVHLSESKAYVTANEFLNQAAYRLKPNQVRIYNETVPFPHMAIEIDGRVYSYGQTHMTVRPVREYLSTEIINEMIREKQQQEPQGSFTLDHALQITGLTKISRSVQMVTLNLSETEKNQLRRHLELQTGNRYRNYTLVMDCASMVVQALERQTNIQFPGGQSLTMDASPSLVMMYLGLLKTNGAKNIEGQNLVENIQQIALAEPEKREKHLIRGLYINAMEAKIFTHFFHYNMAFRQYLHARYGADGFQYLQPEVRKEIEGWHRLVVEDFKNGATQTDAQILVFVQEAKMLGQVPTVQRDHNWEKQKSRLMAVSGPFLQEAQRQERESFESSQVSFADLIRSGYRLQLYQNIEAHLRDLLISGEAALEAGNPAEILNSVR